MCFYKNKVIYQLPNGKSIEMSVEQYLSMTDEELNGLVALNWGQTIEDPFSSSALRSSTNDCVDMEFEELDPDMLSPDDLADLTELNSIEKLDDLDYTFEE